MSISRSEVRCWLLKKGLTTPEAATVVDTNISRGFIRGDVVNYDDLQAFYLQAASQGQTARGDEAGLKMALDALRMDGLARGQGGRLGCACLCSQICCNTYCNTAGFIFSSFSAISCERRRHH